MRCVMFLKNVLDLVSNAQVRIVCWTIHQERPVDIAATGPFVPSEGTKHHESCVLWNNAGGRDQGAERLSRLDAGEASCLNVGPGRSNGRLKLSNPWSDTHLRHEHSRRSGGTRSSKPLSMLTFGR